MGVLYFELAVVPGDVVETQPFMRLCLALEKRFPYIRGWQQIQDLCDIATENENCFFTFRDTWLKTTVTLKNPDSLFRRPLSKDELRERIRSSNYGPGVDDHSWAGAVQRYRMQLLRRLALTTAEVADVVGPQITIRRNVLPRKRYWLKLLESYRFPHLTRDFYTRRILDESLREGKSLQEIRREPCFKCALAMSLHRKLPAESSSTTTSPEAAAGVVDLQSVDPTHIILVNNIASGSEGSVSKVVWRNCTYAMKMYTSLYMASFERDHKIATMRPVLHHPHIVQAFGHLFVEDEYSDADQTRPNCLLMELLDGDLLGVMYEAARSTTPLSRLDKLDVLLQIACGMERLHENKVVHGDLKPGNILLGDFEVSGHVRHFLAKVADFGSAKIMDPRSNFVPSMGTKEYASPEVLMMRRSVMEKLVADGRAKPTKLDVPAKSDVYSFGVIAYESLTDCKAFSKDIRLGTVDEIYKVAKGETRLIDSKEWETVTRLGFYDEVVPLVEKCLEWDPKERPTFSDVCATLRCARSNLQAEERRDLEEFRNLQKIKESADCNNQDKNLTWI